MERWNDVSAVDKKKKTSHFLTPMFHYSNIPSFLDRLRAGEGGDDRTFTAFRTPNGNTSSWGQSYQGSEKIPTLSTYFHSYFSGYATLIN